MTPKQNANQDEKQQLNLIYQLMRLLPNNRDFSGSSAGSENNEQHGFIIVIGNTSQIALSRTVTAQELLYP